MCGSRHCLWLILVTLTLPQPAGGVRSPEAPLVPDPEAVRAALDRAIGEPEARSSFRLLVECQRDGRLPALVVYGRGVGVWDGRRQFALAAEDLRSLLLALRDRGFAELAPSYGGRAARERVPTPGDDAAVQVTCRVRVALAEITIQVVQLAEGEQSPELARLADELYRVVANAARTGVEAASLEQGLEMVARGELAPEALSATFHRKPELMASEGGRPAFLLRLEGRTASGQDYETGSGYGPARELELGVGELTELATALAAHRPERFPANLWAPDYNDLALAVLDHRVSVQARRFSRMTPATHGEVQADFDAIAETLERLYRRVARDGTVASEH